MQEEYLFHFNIIIRPSVSFRSQWRFTLSNSLQPFSGSLQKKPIATVENMLRGYFSTFAQLSLSGLLINWWKAYCGNSVNGLSISTLYNKPYWVVKGLGCREYYGIDPLTFTSDIFCCCGCGNAIKAYIRVWIGIISLHYLVKAALKLLKCKWYWSNGRVNLASVI